MTVRKKPDPTPPATEKQLRAALETLRQESAAARQRVLRLLAEGQNTGDLRMEITALERRIEDIAAVLAALAAEREREDAANVASSADALATDAIDRLEVRLASLQPPPHPTTKGTDQ
jgi:DNA repair exonuclease SbcCD ATPase subunit